MSFNIVDLIGEIILKHSFLCHPSRKVFIIQKLKNCQTCPKILHTTPKCLISELKIAKKYAVGIALIFSLSSLNFQHLLLNLQSINFSFLQPCLATLRQGTTFKCNLIHFTIDKISKFSYLATDIKKLLSSQSHSSKISTCNHRLQCFFY